jgi:uroporphyrinogen decarboxylase
MNGRERVNQAIARQPVHPWPWGELCLDDQLVREYLGCPRISFEQRLDFVTGLSLDLVCLSPVYTGSGAAADLPRPQDIAWPDLTRWSRETGLFVFVLLEGPFSWGGRVAGLAGFLTNLLRHPQEAADFMLRVSDLNTQMAKLAIEQGADGILLADDIAYQRGCLVDPELLRRLFFPPLGALAGAIKSLGRPMFYHSDGNLNAVLDDLAALDLAGLQCLESASGMDLKSIQTKYGRQWCLWGNLDPGHLAGPLDQTLLMSQISALAPAAERGGFIFGTSSGLFAGIKPENLRELKRLLRPGGNPMFTGGLA